MSALDQLGKRLAHRRAEAGLTTYELASAAKIRESDLMGHEGGQKPLPVAALARAANALGVPVAGLVDLDAAEVRAPREPSLLLKSMGLASIGEADVSLLSHHLARARAFATLGNILGVERLDSQFTRSPPPKHGAHLIGYQAANKARGLLPEREGALNGLARLIENRFNTLVVRVTFTKREILGATCRSGEARLIAVNRSISQEPRVRFVLAHELCHQLVDLDAEGASTDVDDQDPKAFWMENPPIEKRANAFAAMFLASEQAVQKALGPAKGEGYGLDDARALTLRAQRIFGLSFAAMAWHLHNLKYIKTPETVLSLLMDPEGADLPSFEEATRFDGLERRVLEALSREMISRGRAAELLGRNVEELEELPA